MAKKGRPLQTEFNFRSLMVKEENGRYRMATAEEILDAARRELDRRFRRAEALTSPELTREFLRVNLAPKPFEVFAVIWLDLCAVLRNVELGHPGRLLMRIRRCQLHISGYSRRNQLTMLSCSGATCPAWGGGITSGKT